MIPLGLGAFRRLPHLQPKFLPSLACSKETLNPGETTTLGLFLSVSAPSPGPRHLVHVAIPRPEASTVGWDNFLKTCFLTQPVCGGLVLSRQLGGLLPKIRDHSSIRSSETSEKVFWYSILTFLGWLPPQTEALLGSPISPTTTLAIRLPVCDRLATCIRTNFRDRPFESGNFWRAQQSSYRHTVRCALGAGH